MDPERREHNSFFIRLFSLRRSVVLITSLFDMHCSNRAVLSMPRFHLPDDSHVAWSKGLACQSWAFSLHLYDILIAGLDCMYVEHAWIMPFESLTGVLKFTPIENGFYLGAAVTDSCSGHARLTFGSFKTQGSSFYGNYRKWRKRCLWTFLKFKERNLNLL